LRHVYTGNVHDEAGQSTYCHACGERVIGRNWYEITSWALDDNGCCRSCGAQCAGVFEQGHGSWGAAFAMKPRFGNCWIWAWPAW
jgi:pyruvate formate lyase activating enzyme